MATRPPRKRPARTARPSAQRERRQPSRREPKPGGPAGARVGGRSTDEPESQADALELAGALELRDASESLAKAAPVGTAAEPAQAGRPVTTVCVGMSAGGLEACTQLLEALPDRPGFAIVLVQHLAPHHPSALPTLLAHRTGMRVTQAEDGAVLEPDHVYVIPPDMWIELGDGALQLSPRPEEPGRVLPVDFFLKSVAVSQGDRAIAVILSGTGSDGVVGGRAVKEQGGTVLVQEPSSARYDGMPRGAIMAGIADIVAPPAEIAEKLVQLAGGAYARPGSSAIEELAVSDQQWDELFSILRRGSGGVDFSHYKQPTIKRRILRRMALGRIVDFGRYLELLRDHEDEARSLYQDILIHVTRFFREPESFEALERDVLPKLLAARRPESPLRMWVAGCATGEEAYSLAMTIWEAAGDAAPELAVQIFGTDVSESAIEYARAGEYPPQVAQDIPPERLRRFFSKVDGGYRVAKTIRDRCIFARQDLTRDPPFSKLDLILCRNVLIYMDSMLQKRLLPIFHYALRPDGFLVLGHAETVGAHADLFALVDKKHRIYQKTAGGQALATLPAPAYGPARVPARPAARADRSHDPRLAQNEANRVVLERFVPPGVLVDESLEVIQFRGRTGPFLEPPPGEASLNLLKLAREGLLHGLRSALQAARRSHRPVRKEGLRVRSNGGWTVLDLSVLPLTSLHSPHYLILFEARPPRGRGAKAPVVTAESRLDSRRSVRVEQELAATREYLQSIIQEVEAANEELQSANEEILSSNEELQSTNEELDTAKEELQSTNEELNTLNDELHARNEELTRVNSDLVNLLGSVQIAVVIVSTDLRIRRFTPVAEKMLNLIASDLGRPITQVRPNFDCPQLGELILGVIETVTPMEREVLDREGRWFSLRIRPYKGLENRIEGAVLALVDVDVAKRHEMEITQARRLAEEILASVHQPLAVLDSSSCIRSLNRSFEELLGLPPGESRGRRLWEVGGVRWDVSAVRQLLEAALALPQSGGELLRAPLGEGPEQLSLYAKVIDAVGQDERLVLLGVEQPGGEPG